MRRTFSMLVMALAGLGLLGACGGDGGGGAEVASIDDDAAQSVSSDEDGDDELTPEESEEAFREFAACMREHGIDMPDPEFTEGGPGGGSAVRIGRGPGEGGEGEPFDEEAFEEADKECRHLIEDVVRAGPRGDLDPEEEAEMRDRALAFAKCMREHGIDMPDPEFGEGGRVTQQFNGGRDVDEDKFQDASEACSGEFDGEGGPVIGIGPQAQTDAE